MDDAAYGREIARRLGGHLGSVKPIGRRWSYPLSAMHAARYVDTRMALVGDAAHGIHPIAGQGLNLGFRDVDALASLVIEAVARGDDPGGAALLARYQAKRRPDSLLMLGATHVLERLFANDIAPIRIARPAWHWRSGPHAAAQEFLRAASDGDEFRCWRPDREMMARGSGFLAAPSIRSTSHGRDNTAWAIPWKDRRTGSTFPLEET
jgi:2-polyprenyl-6-methoxyphenol hydroxylase-like FAD-dependent oxidoreductase